MTEAEGAAPQDRPDARATTDDRTLLPATFKLLEAALASGDQSAIAVVRRMVEGRADRQAASLRAHRGRLFDAATIERLEMDDRRRDAARRLPPICDETHPHDLPCRDPLADVG